MTTYIIRRLLLLIPTLFGITLLTYILVRAAPGNAALVRGGGGAMGSHAMTAEARKQMIHLLGLDKPPIIAYGDWLWRLLHLDLGTVLRRPPARRR